MLSKAEIVLSIEPNNNINKKLANESNTGFVKNVLSFKFVNCIHLSLITILIEIEMRIRFYFIFISVYFIE